MLVLAVFLSGCVTFYTNEPDPQKPNVVKKFVLNYSVLTSRPKYRQAVARGFQETGFYKFALQAYSLEDFRRKGGKGPLFVNVRVEEKQKGAVGVIWTYITYGFLFLLPGYVSGGSFVTFEVYKGNQKIREYNYENNQNTVTWLGLIPFAWLNLVTYSDVDVVELAARKFTEEISKDPEIMQMAARGP